MDLSADIENLQQQIKAGSSNSEGPAGLQDLGDFLDLSGLDLDNEETWLYETTQCTNTQNAKGCPSENNEESYTSQPSELGVPKLKSTKMIDTRTFTRPKKKYSRPSINDIEQMYLSGSDGNEMNSSTEEKQSPRTKVPLTVQEEQETVPSEPTKPVQFDLSQPTSLHNFETFMLNSTDIDSFQNMSPPSLVNSLCSSTFANLMESSFIKNDPVLREIRDKDFTEAALLQDMEAPLFQSITESCSSFNSDIAENILRKVSRDSTFRKNVSASENNVTIMPERNLPVNLEGNGVGGNATFEVQSLSADSSTENQNSTFGVNTTNVVTPVTDDTSSSTNSCNSQNAFGNLNGTYRRTPKHNGTFSKSDLKNNRLSLNLTYETTLDTTHTILDRGIPRSIENDMNSSNKGSSEDLNSTRTKSSGKSVILRSDSIEELKKRFSSSEGSIDLNRISYCQQEKEDQINKTYKDDDICSELNRTVEIKRSSLGSADSLDRMSSLSSSSKGSNKVLSMEDVEAIVEMQERSLSQGMSTPKGPIGNKNLWEHNFISPIVANTKDALSDSDLSDEYKSVKSHVSSKISLDTWKKPSAKSLNYLAVNKEVKLKTNQRSSYTLAGQKPLQALPNSIRGSYGNISSLKNTTVTLGGSQQNLYRPPSAIVRPPSSSNLKRMGTKLKGSYTSLRPISSTLPVVPPVGSTLNGTHTITRPNTSTRTSVVNVPKTVTTVKMEVPPVTKVIHANHGGDDTFVKPQTSRTSGLPRPTGIPRPSSRIPAPRSSNIRPTSSRNTNY